MKIIGQDIWMHRGDSYPILVELEEPLLPGDTVYFTAIPISGGGPGISKVITSFPDGELQIPFEPNDTKTLAIGVYEYDIRLARGTDVYTIAGDADKRPPRYTLVKEKTTL